jgi:hypothetical protein
MSEGKNSNATSSTKRLLPVVVNVDVNVDV